MWGGIFFSLVNKTAKVIMSRVWMILCPASLISYMFFGNDLGDISVNFVYFQPFEFSPSQKAVNLAVVTVVVIAFAVLAYFKPKITNELIMALAAVSLIMSIINMIPINKAYRDNLRMVQSEYPRITLSSQGQNVTEANFGSAMASTEGKEQ